MKALTIRQPSAWAILTGLKPLLNTPRPFNHRGPLLIHSSQTEETHMVEDMLEIAARQTGTDIALLRNAYSQQARRGVILGAVTVKGCVTWHVSPWFFGPHALILERPAKALDPIPCKGALGLWQVPADVMAALEIPGYVERLR